MNTIENTASGWKGWVQKPTWGEALGGAVFFAFLLLCLWHTKQLIATNATHALFWYGGAILACETALSFLDYQGRKGAVAALVLRLFTFVAGYAALMLTQ